MKDSMKGEVLFIHGAKAFWDVHKGLKKFKEKGGKVVRELSSKVTMMAVYDPADIEPSIYSMAESEYDKLMYGLNHCRWMERPILTADDLTAMFQKQEKLDRLSMYEHLAQAQAQPAGAVFF